MTLRFDRDILTGDFIKLWAATMLSSIGNWAFIVGVAFTVYLSSSSLLLTSTIFIAQTLPRVILGSFAGVAADRWNRRVLLTSFDVVRAAIIAVALVPWVAGHPIAIDAIVAAEATATLVYMPARQSILPSLIPRDKLKEGNSWLQLGLTISGVVGPALGSALLLASHGLRAAVLVDVASYLVSAILFFLLALPESKDEAQTAKPGFLDQWRAGWRYISERSWIYPIVALLVLVLLSDGILMTGVVGFMGSVITGGVAGYADVKSASAVSSLLGSLLAVRVSKTQPILRMLSFGLLASGASFVACFLSDALPLVVILYSLAGLANVFWIVAYTSLLQKHVPDNLRGRLFGALGSIQGVAMLAGIVVIGSLGNVIGIRSMDVAAGALTVCAGLIALTRVREPLADAGPVTTQGALAE